MKQVSEIEDTWDWDHWEVFPTELMSDEEMERGPRRMAMDKCIV
jgi:hypothetical protein